MEQGVEMNRNEQNVTAFVAAIGVSPNHLQRSQRS
jgi:hypothetical protein